jgi:hypothetical protein
VYVARRHEGQLELLAERLQLREPSPVASRREQFDRDPDLGREQLRQPACFVGTRLDGGEPQTTARG